MASKEMSIEKLARSLGVDASEAREKQRLIELIKKTRKDKKLSQAALAKRIGVTQGRIAQIESKVGTTKVTFEVLFGLLRELGFELRVIAKRVA